MVLGGCRGCWGVDGGGAEHRLGVFDGHGVAQLSPWCRQSERHRGGRGSHQRRGIGRDWTADSWAICARAFARLRAIMSRATSDALARAALAFEALKRRACSAFGLAAIYAEGVSWVDSRSGK